MQAAAHGCMPIAVPSRFQACAVVMAHAKSNNEFQQHPNTQVNTQTKLAPSHCRLSHATPTGDLSRQCLPAHGRTTWNCSWKSLVSHSTFILLFDKLVGVCTSMKHVVSWSRAIFSVFQTFSQTTWRVVVVLSALTLWSDALQEQPCCMCS